MPRKFHHTQYLKLAALESVQMALPSAELGVGGNPLGLSVDLSPHLFAHTPSQPPCIAPSAFTRRSAVEQVGQCVCSCGKYHQPLPWPSKEAIGVLAVIICLRYPKSGHMNFLRPVTGVADPARPFPLTVSYCPSLGPYLNPPSRVVIKEKRN